MKKNYLKTMIGCLTLFAAIGTNAQTTTGDIAKQLSGTASGSVKLVDNKGTIKYLQAANGLTTLTNTTNDRTTTTWQLGGTLTADTYIDVNESVFALDGIELIDTETSAPSSDTTDQSDHGTGSGWTLLVRDEATGAVKKLKATDLIQGGSYTHNQLSDADADFNISVPGISSEASQAWVYRNGAKLIAGTDYVVDADQVTIQSTTSDFPVYSGDIIEIQWIK